MLFFALNFVVSANFEASVGIVERWIVKATCDQYELTGTVRDSRGRAVPYAVVEASYLDERLTTRSRGDGGFRLAGSHKTCDERPEVVSVYVSAEDFREKRRVLQYDEATLDVVLDRAEFYGAGLAATVSF